MLVIDKNNIATFEDDKQIVTKMAGRSIVASTMLALGAIAAYYSNGEYYFVFKNGEHVSQSDVSDKLNKYGYRSIGIEYKSFYVLCNNLEIVRLLGLNADMFEVPPSFPIIDPIYFGT